MKCIHSVAYESTHPLNINYYRKNSNSTNFFDALTRVLLKYNTIYSYKETKKYKIQNAISVTTYVLYVHEIVNIMA